MSEVRHATDPVSGRQVEINNSLVNRLRGKYAIGPTLPNGEPEFGWRQMGAAIPIQDEAAAEIENLRAALLVLADAADVVGVKYFDTDTMDPEVEDLQVATSGARALLNPT